MECEWFAWGGDPMACNLCGGSARTHDQGIATVVGIGQVFRRPWKPGEVDELEARWGAARQLQLERLGMTHDPDPVATLQRERFKWPAF